MTTRTMKAVHRDPPWDTLRVEGTIPIELAQQFALHAHFDSPITICGTSFKVLGMNLHATLGAVAASGWCWLKPYRGVIPKATPLDGPLWTHII